MTRKTHLAGGALVTGFIILNANAILFPSLMGWFLGSTSPDYDFLIGKHRGFSHSLFCSLILATIGYIINPTFGVVFGFNYLFHLALDSFTKMGVPIFAPFDKNYYGARLIKTGDGIDFFLCIVFIFIVSTFVV